MAGFRGQTLLCQTSLAASIPKPGQPQTSQSQSLCQPHFAGSAGFLLLLLSLNIGPLGPPLIWWTYSGSPSEGCMPLFHTVPVLVSFLLSQEGQNCHGSGPSAWEASHWSRPGMGVKDVSKCASPPRVTNFVLGIVCIYIYTYYTYRTIYMLFSIVWWKR